MTEVNYRRVQWYRNICSWKRRKKLKVSKSDVESYNPHLASKYFVKSQPVLKFNLNDFRPYNF